MSLRVANGTKESQNKEIGKGRGGGKAISDFQEERRKRPSSNTRAQKRKGCKLESHISPRRMEVRMGLDLKRRAERCVDIYLKQGGKKVLQRKSRSLIKGCKRVRF